MGEYVPYTTTWAEVAEARKAELTTLRAQLAEAKDHSLHLTTELMKGALLIRDLKRDVDRLKASEGRLRGALDTIGGGHTTRFPGAPEITEHVRPVAWQADMWGWSQRVAKAALAGPGEGEGKQDESN